jgi:hypothetical protein
VGRNGHPGRGLRVRRYSDLAFGCADLTEYISSRGAGIESSDAMERLEMILNKFEARANAGR